MLRPSRATPSKVCTNRSSTTDADDARARAHLVHARGDIGRDLAWLRQDRRQTDGLHDALDRRAAAWIDGEGGPRWCRGGGVNPRPFTPAQEVPFRNETVQPSEVGVKSD